MEEKRIHTLYEAGQHFTPCLQKRVSGHNLQEPLQSLAAMLDHVVAEAVGEHLARERGDGDARALSLQDIAEVLKVRVAAAHDGVFELEGGDVGAADDLVRGVHVAGCAVGLGVAHLDVRVSRVRICKAEGLKSGVRLS